VEDDLLALIELCAVLACTLFAGAAIYINVAEHPARLLCGPEIAAAEFAPSYRRAAVMQVFLAVTATLAGTARWVQGGATIWLAAALLIFAVIPFTLIAIRPINNRLLDPRRDRGSAETMALLETWGRLHAIRSALSLVAAVLFIWATASGAAAVVTGPHDVDVFASRGWQPSEARVEAGRAVTITHLSGGVQDAATSIPDANGSDYVCGAPDCCEPAPDSRRSALLARVGRHVVTIGNGATFTSPTAGEIELRINDCDEGLSDNRGTLAVRITN
jgi:Anthrone oxygenase